MAKEKNENKCRRCAELTSIIGLVAGLLLAAFKLTIGFIGRSRALMASGMCNIGDVSSSIAVLLGMHYSQKAPTKRYHYGFGKLEFIIQVAISGLMILGTIIIMSHSFIIIAKRHVIVPHIVVFFVAIVSAIVNGLIYKFAKCGAKQLNSPVLTSHARHNKIDVIASLLVAIGVIAARFGLHWVDPLVAIFECLDIVYGSWHIFWSGFKGLMDTNVSKEYAEKVKHNALEVKDVLGVPLVRARQSGSKMFLDIAIEVSPSTSVVASKRIIQSLRAHLRQKDRHIGNIFVQLVPVS